jgi:hypothetical protein
MDEKTLTLISNGKHASHLLHQINPYLEEVKNEAISRLKNMYRTSEFTEAKLLAIAAELCTIDDIDNKIRAKIRIGQKKSEEFNAGNSKPTTSR